MPALSNPRHEAFAQAIFAGLAGKTRLERANSTAYITAYPSCTNRKSAKAAAARLLARVSPILDRVRELQADANKRIQPKLDISRETIGRRLRMASEMAEEQKSPTAIAACELGMAKVFHRLDTPDDQRIDFTTANSMTDIGRKLLQSVGFASPDDVSIQAAIEANDAFIERLEAIREAQGLTLEHKD